MKPSGRQLRDELYIPGSVLPHTNRQLSEILSLLSYSLQSLYGLSENTSDKFTCKIIIRTMRMICQG